MAGGAGAGGGGPDRRGDRDHRAGATPSRLAEEVPEKNPVSAVVAAGPGRRDDQRSGQRSFMRRNRHGAAGAGNPAIGNGQRAGLTSWASRSCRSRPRRSSRAGRNRAIVPGQCEGRYYMMMCGAGFDGRVVRAVGPRLKRLLGKGAFVVATARQLWIGGIAPLAVAIDGAPPVAAASVVVSRGTVLRRAVRRGAEGEPGRRAAACLPVRPRRPVSRRWPISSGWGSAGWRAATTMRWCRRSAWEIAGAAGEPGVQADGEACGSVPIRIALAERALNVLVP